MKIHTLLVRLAGFCLRASRPIMLTAATLALTVGLSHAQDEEARRHWLHELGGPFFVSRDPVQVDLHLSEDQKQKLRPELSSAVQEVETVQNLKPSEREPAMRSLREKSYPKLETSLQQILTPDQFKRFQQLKLQYNIPAIMLQPEIGQELSITEEQRGQFMGLVQAMQKDIVPLMQQAKSSGNPKQILPQVIKLRQDCQAKIEALLTVGQKARWKEMTGEPLVIW